MRDHFGYAGFADTYVGVIRDGVIHGFRPNVRVPSPTGLAAYRAAKRQCVERIRELAGGEAFHVTRVSLMRLPWNERIVSMTVWVADS